MSPAAHTFRLLMQSMGEVELGDREPATVFRPKPTAE